MRAKIRAALAHVAAPLIAGGLLYVGARSDGLLLWRWARALGIEPALRAVREALALLADAPSWARFTLPDALWVYALTATLCLLHRRPRAYLLVPLALGPGAELLQAAGWLPGTYDPLDLLATSLALALAAALTSTSRSSSQTREGAPREGARPRARTIS